MVIEDTYNGYRSILDVLCERILGYVIEDAYNGNRRYL
jgi:hypothetical protein